MRSAAAAMLGLALGHLVSDAARAQEPTRVPVIELGSLGFEAGSDGP